jgi:hypothetical protein
MLLDATNYSVTRPDAFGGRLSIRYTASIWAPGDDADELPTKSFFQANVANADRVCLDIENWDAATMLERFPTMIAWAKEARPGISVGFYGILPNRQWYPPLDYYGTPTNSAYAATYASWVAEMDPWVASGIGIGCTYPSLYSVAGPLTTAAPWKHYARFNVRQSRRMGRRVCGVAWALYHDSLAPTIPFPTYVGDAIWREQVRYAASLCDDVAIWGDVTDGTTAQQRQTFFDVAAEGYEQARKVRCRWRGAGVRSYA